MDALRAELAARKKETKEVFGTKRYMKRSELEELRLKRSREEKDPAPNEVRLCNIFQTNVIYFREFNAARVFSANGSMVRKSNEDRLDL